MSNVNMRSFLWLAFAVVCSAGVLARTQLWMLPHYTVALSGLAVIAVAFGVWLIATSDHPWHAVLLVALGVVIGQWGAIIQAILMLGWAINGFSP